MRENAVVLEISTRIGAEHGDDAPILVLQDDDAADATRERMRTAHLTHDRIADTA